MEQTGRKFHHQQRITPYRRQNQTARIKYIPESQPGLGGKGP